MSITDQLRLEGYDSFRTLPDGQLSGLMDYLFTCAIVVGLDATGYRGRYCYPSRAAATQAFVAWNGIGDPGGPWIKYKGSGGERLGPGATAELTHPEAA
jgi:hypothetical protein